MRIIGCFSLAILFVLSANAQVHRLWTQTSVSDFSNSTFDNTIVTNRDGGEVRLQYPLIKTQGDTLDNNFLWSVWFDHQGNFIRTWSVLDTVFVRRYDSSGAAISPALKVNETGRGVSTLFGRVVNGALMDNGYFYVVWCSTDSAHAYGQLYNQLNQKIGGHLRFDPFYSSSWKGNPCVFADASDSTFGVIESYRTAPGVDSLRIYYWRVDSQGQKIGEMKRLQADVHLQFARSAFAAISPNYEFVVTWIEDNDIVSGGNWMYWQRFSKNGEPLNGAQLVTDVNGTYLYDLRIRFDSQGKSLVVWQDNRNAAGRQSYYDIYAQFFDSDGSRIGGNFSVNDTVPTGAPFPQRPEARFDRGLTRISYLKYNQPLGRYDTYYTGWTLNERLEGTCRSFAFDAGPLIQAYDTIRWNRFLPVGTALRFQLRSGSTLAEIDTASWYGPISQSDFYASSGTAINARHNLQRYIQYNGYFSTTHWGDAPELQDMTIGYNLSQALPPLPPTNLIYQTSSSLVRLSWQASPSGRIFEHKVYRGTQAGVFDSLWTKRIPHTELSYSDTTVRNGLTYFYAVTVVDSSYLESGFSNQVSVTPDGMTYYVRAGALPGGNGTIEFPFSTITDGLNVGTWGDTIMVLPGVYPEFLRIQKKGVRLIGSGPSVTRIESTPTGDIATIIWGADSCLIKGFTIAVTRTAAIWDDAIVAYPGSPIITDNMIVNETSGSPSGVYARSGSPVFLRNYVIGFNVGFFYFDSSWARVENNVFVGTDGAHINGPRCFPRFVNNTIVASRWGIYTTLGPAGNIRNNIICGTGASLSIGVRVDNGALTLDYNDVWGFSQAYGGNSGAGGTGNILVDPMFLNRARADYRLRTNSPCRDAGDPSPEYNDLDLTRNDMGAFGGPGPIDPTIFPGMPITFGTGNASGFPGDTVTVGVNLSDAARFSRGHFEIYYLSSFMRLVSVLPASLTQNFQLMVDTSTSGHLGVDMYSASEVGTGSGDILLMVFRISTEAVQGNASPVTGSSVQLRDSVDEPLLVREIRNGTVALSPGSGSGRYIYVDYRNTGSEDGTRQRPYRTIQAGIDYAHGGDTVIVSSGSYEGMVTMRDSIHLQGSGAGVTSVRGTSTHTIDPSVKFFMTRASRISGFTILSPVGILGPNILCDSSDAVIDHNCLKHNSQVSVSGTIDIENGSVVSLTDNYFYSEGSVDEYIYASRSTVIVTRNVIGTELGEGGMRIVGQARARIGNNIISFGSALANGIDINQSLWTLIYNNLFLKGRSPSTALYIRNSDSVTVVNNTFDTQYRGIDDLYSRTVVMNNIITGNAGFGLTLGSNGSSSYNDVWGNTSNYHNITPGVGDVSSDPLFVNRVGRNYRVEPASPARDAGNPSFHFNDLDGSRNDMGLYGGPLLDTTMFPVRGSALRLSDVSIAVGDTVALPLMAMMVRDLASATIQMSYNESLLRFVGARTTLVSSPLSLAYAQLGGGIIRLTMTGPQGISADSVRLIDVLFAARQLQGTGSVAFQQVQCNASNLASIAIQELLNGQVSIGPTSAPLQVTGPVTFSLLQNYPNPFNPSTTIKYDLPKDSRVSLKLFNIIGQEVATLVNEEQKAGYKSVEWNASGVASGVYFYRLNAGSYTSVKKLLLLK